MTDQSFPEIEDDLPKRMQEARYFLNFRQEGFDCDHADLIDEAADEIQRLQTENWQLKKACGYPIPADKETPQNPFKCGICDARSLDEAARATDRDQLIALADDIRAAQRDYMADRGNHEKGRAVAAAANAYDKARESLVSVQNIAATPTNRQLHDAIARAVTHRTYSGIQDAVREIQKLYGDLAQSSRDWKAEATRRFGPIPSGRGENARLIAAYHYAFEEGAKAALSIPSTPSADPISRPQRDTL